MFFASGFVEVVVSADTMGGGRLAGDDGKIVWVSDGRHGGCGSFVEAGLNEFGEGGCGPLFDARLEVGWIEAIDTNYNGWAFGEGVGTVVEGNGLWMSGAVCGHHCCCWPINVFLCRVEKSNEKLEAMDQLERSCNSYSFNLVELKMLYDRDSMIDISQTQR